MSNQVENSPFPTPMVTSTRRDGASHQAPQHLILADITAQLDQVGQGYNENFTMVSDIVDSVIDVNEQLFARRKLLVESALEMLRETKSTAARIEREDANYDEVDDLMEKLHNLEDQKHRLLLEQENMVAKNEQVNKERKQNMERLAQLSSKNKVLSKNANENLPLLTFVRKVLAAVSSVTVHKPKDPKRIEGFISKNDKQDVVPFSCSLSDPSYDYVNHIWDIVAD